MITLIAQTSAIVMFNVYECNVLLSVCVSVVIWCTADGWHQPEVSANPWHTADSWHVGRQKITSKWWPTLLADSVGQQCWSTVSGCLVRPWVSPCSGITAVCLDHSAVAVGHWPLFANSHFFCQSFDRNLHCSCWWIAMVSSVQAGQHILLLISKVPLWLLWQCHLNWTRLL